MKPYLDYAVTNNRKNILKTFETEKEARNFIKTIKVGEKIKTEFLFWGTKTHKVTKKCYLQKRIISNGGADIMFEKPIILKK